MSELYLEQVDYRLTPEGYEMSASEPEALHGQQIPDEISYDALVERLIEGNQTYEVTEDSAGIKHESIVFNADQMTKALILKPSTSFSGAVKNPANVLETALAATLNPDAAYLYSTSDGNYPGGHMSREERAYRRHTGRYIKGDGSAEHPYQPLDYLKHFVDMLGRQDRLPTHIVADQEAGRISLGVMAALGANSIKGVYLNGIDGISPTASYVRAPFIEDMQSRVRRRSGGDGQVGELTPVNIKDVKRRMPNIYSGLGRVAHLAPLPVFLFPLDVRDKVSLTLGFRGHKNLEDLGDHAVYQDMRAALMRQKTIITMQFNADSHQHDLEDCKTFGQAEMDGIPPGLRDPERGVRLLLGNGTWTQNTDAPYESARTQRLALPDIAHRMAVYAGGRMLDSQIFGLSAVARSA